MGLERIWGRAGVDEQGADTGRKKLDAAAVPCQVQLSAT